MLKQKKALKKDLEIERVAFNAVTKQAVQAALKEPREIDDPLVSAYLARRALDYLVGFTLSPVLWRKLPGARSAGRVQSVALRLVCDREAEIEAFKYRGILDDRGAARTAGRGVRGPPHRPSPGKALKKLDIKDAASAHAIKAAIEGQAFASGASVEKKATRRNPYAPFTTSTLQQEASRKLGFSRQEDDAGRPAPLRGRRRRRRDRRPHHLHANRRRADRARGGRRDPRGDRDAVRRRYLPVKPRVQDQGEERAGGARGDPADRRDADCRARWRATSSATSRALRAGLEARRREPDGLRRDRADHRRDRRHGRDGKAYGLRATGSVVQFDGFLAALRGGTATRRTRRAAACRRSPRVIG